MQHDYWEAFFSKKKGNSSSFVKKKKDWKIKRTFGITCSFSTLLIHHKLFFGFFLSFFLKKHSRRAVLSKSWTIVISAVYRCAELCFGPRPLTHSYKPFMDSLCLFGLETLFRNHKDFVTTWLKKGTNFRWWTHKKGKKKENIKTSKGQILKKKKDAAQLWNYTKTHPSEKVFSLVTLMW